MPRNNDVEPSDQCVGGGPHSQQWQILAVLLPVGAQFQQKQILNAQRLDYIGPSSNFESLVDWRMYVDVAQQNSAPEILRCRHIQSKLLAVDPLQLPLQLENGFVGKIPEIQVNVLGKSTNAMRTQGGSPHGDNRIVNRGTQCVRAFNQQANNGEGILYGKHDG